MPKLDHPLKYLLVRVFICLSNVYNKSRELLLKYGRHHCNERASHFDLY